jgi:hypothetical protein
VYSALNGPVEVSFIIMELVCARTLVENTSLKTWILNASLPSDVKSATAVIENTA